MKNLNPKELQELLASGECELVDVREPMEWAGGRIPEARHIPLGELESRCEEVESTRPVVVMCRTGKRSAKGAEILRRKGIENVTELAGGFQEWQAAGLPSERDEKAPWPIERQVRVAAGALVVTGLALSLLWPWAIALSWFVGGGLIFAGLTDWCGMGLLLARAPWNRPGKGAVGGTPCSVAKAPTSN